jgi:hypothetical protein
LAANAGLRIAHARRSGPAGSALQFSAIAAAGKATIPTSTASDFILKPAIQGEYDQFFIDRAWYRV